MKKEASSGKEIWTLYGYVVRSKYRKLAVKTLYQTPAIPKEIAQLTGVPQSHVSRALKQLESRGVVICINPQNKKGKVYKLTEHGVKVAEVILRKKTNRNLL